ncbi:TPA: sigma-70 family RNA polymerase sigma factor [Candidatus Poribacteria bacterium]|nr:sigma-70 family RNA polymerase sigma factor [Candidatus Poribacteria bacterium]
MSKKILSFSLIVGKFASYMLNDEEEAKDVTQEAFLKAWQVFEDIRRETAKAWLLKTATNLCIDRLRRRKFQSAWDEYNDEYSGLKIGNKMFGTIDQTPDPLEQCLNQETRELVQKAIAQLPPAYRTAVVLRDLEELSYEEIAVMLNQPIGTVKSNVFRGRRMLKKILRPMFEV